MKTLISILTSPLTWAFVFTVILMSILAYNPGGLWILFGLLGIPIGLGVNYIFGKLIKKTKSK